MELYIVERRRTCDGETEDNDCYISISIVKTIYWIKRNKDFDTENSNWYWAILKCELDDEYGSELYKIFDCDGNELLNQPIETNKNSEYYGVFEKDGDLYKQISVSCYKSIEEANDFVEDIESTFKYYDKRNSIKVLSLKNLKKIKNI